MHSSPFSSSPPHFFRNAAHGFSLIPVDSLKVTMKEILQKALKKRKGSQKGSGRFPLILWPQQENRSIFETLN